MIGVTVDEQLLEGRVGGDGNVLGECLAVDSFVQI